MNSNRTLEKEFDTKYNSPAMKLHLEEQGWKYVGERNDKPLFKIVY